MDAAPLTAGAGGQYPDFTLNSIIPFGADDFEDDDGDDIRSSHMEG
jgi:hypothetical protein